MRITEGMLHDRALRDLSTNLDALSRSQEQVSTTRRLNRPSDDPAAVRSVVNLKDGLAEIEQYLRNADAASRGLSAADTALGSAGDDMQRVRELALQAANGTLTASDRATIADEVEQLTAHLAQLAGTKVGDAYIFSGFRTDRAPYAIPASGSAAVGGYQGDGGAILGRIAPNVTMPTNITGDVAFGPAFAALQQLDTELRAGTAPSAATMTGLDAGLAALVAGRATVGARANRLEVTQSGLQDSEVATKKLISDLQDADMTEVISELSQRQTTYQAALQVNGRILQQSLIDVLR